MNFIECTKDNLASVLMGKDTYVPWRGQRNLIIQIPFDEWFDFIKENRSILTARKPLNYELILGEQNEHRKYKFFMFDCSWALYNEVMCSANIGVDATIILPKFDTEEIISKQEIFESAYRMTQDDYNTYSGKLARAFPHCPCLPSSVLSRWNSDILLLSVYLQSLAYSEKEVRQNIDWR